MSHDGRLNIRLGPLYPHLVKLANRGRKSSRRRPLSEFIFEELEKIVVKKCPDYTPEISEERQPVIQRI
jgi:hypothetical protein